MPDGRPSVRASRKTWPLQGQLYDGLTMLQSRIYDTAPPPVLSGLGIVCGFRPEFLEFQRGIHVGNLEEHERITRILKLALEARYGQPFVTERWGRGVYWHWIGFLPRANRLAKPISSDVSFGCSKFFLMVDTDERAVKFGLQIERGYEKAPRDSRQVELRSDWDWHRLIAALKPRSRLARELDRLVGREGFLLHAGSWEGEPLIFSSANYPGALKLRRALEAAPKNGWAGFQVYYRMSESDVQTTTGLDLVESMLAAYSEVAPAMNLCMQIELVDQLQSISGPRR
jgi:hypothetical protein